MDSQFFTQKLVAEAESGVFRIGPNAAVSSHGLMVDGEVRELRHIEEFKTVVFNSSAAVCTTLAMLFSEPVTAPDGKGDAVPSRVSAWEHYNLHAMKVHIGGADVVESGKVVLQWCLLAQLVAALTEHEVARSTDFLPISLLLDQGGQSLAMSVGDWKRYDHWRRVGHMLALEAGRLSRDPRPAAISVTIPWPEELGVNLGVSEKAFRAAVRIAGDVLVDAAGDRMTSLLSVGNHYVRSPTPSDLVEHFDLKAGNSHNAQLQLNMWDVVFRASRLVWDADARKRQYCFRPQHRG
ncbi:hypothetical protein [Paraburkholderia sp. SIMBA_054]|uniref:hypothetical protein n=1 Tax=Paraburkholderia sp. SIMBA_054 TaxID=3085795 RepID=UPI00397CB0E2